jgi:ribosomal 50S subunit-recycling heat shock protein
MRLVKYLKTTRIFKRRSLATEAAKMGFVTVNGRVAKPSHSVGVGDVIELSTDLFYKKIRVLNIPQEGRNIKNPGEFAEIIIDESRRVR